jgi:hypothetical protein
MGYNLDASVDQRVVPIHDHKLTIRGNKTLELHPDLLATGRLTSHDSSSPYHFLNHTAIGSRYPQKGYDDFFVFNQTGEQVRSHQLVFSTSARHTYLFIRQIANIFKEAELPDTDLIDKIIMPVPGEPTKARVILEGSQSGIRLSFATNRKQSLHGP